MNTNKFDKLNLRIFLSILLGIILLSGCAVNRVYTPEEPQWKDDDKKNIAEPLERDPDLAWTSIKRSAFDQAAQTFDMERTVRKFFGARKESHNINGYDEVPNSSWFINRIGLFSMSPEQIKQGPIKSGGPDTNGDWQVYRPKVGGKTPGFWIKDAKGETFIIKFDPKGYPELSTGAAAMACRYFYACGYNVPEETIVYWKPEQLKIREGATIKEGKVERPLTQDDLNKILAQVDKMPDGRYRSLASKLIPGKPKGPFSYSGIRRDDPNDWCRHENRRELRGLYVIASFINHYDTKDHNTFDTYVEENGNHFIKHYLLDFGSTFGADGDSPKPPKKGYANQVDLRDMFVSLVTLGLKVWPWENGGTIEYPSVGYFESEIFEPNKFDPIMPNPAFDEMTYRDGFWGAKIVMSFSDEDLKALIDVGQYSNPNARDYLFKTLKERRSKIGRYWFSHVNPLDNIEYAKSNEGIRIRFEDLSVKYGFAKAKNTKFKYSVLYNRTVIYPEKEFSQPEFLLSKEELGNMARHHTPTERELPKEHLYQVIIHTKHGDELWTKPLVLWLWFDPLENSFQLVGIDHRSGR